MLKKLIKYDLIWINKVMVIYFLITLIICLFTRVFSLFNDSIFGNIIYAILKGVAISCFVSCIINSLIRSWIRFRNTTYKDESYLINTLPVDKNTLYQSKILSTIISLVIAIIVIIIGFLIAFLNKDIIDFINNIFSNNTGFVLLILLVAILEILYMLFCGLTGIIYGYDKNNKRILRSVLIGIIIYFAMQVLLLGIIYSLSLINSDINNLFINTSLIEDPLFLEKNKGMFRSLLLIVSFLYGGFIIIMYYLSKRKFIKGINVE